MFIYGRVFAQPQTDLNKLSKNQLPAALSELRTFLAIPNDAVNASDMQKNIEWLTDAFQKRKFETKVLSTKGIPLFFAERNFKNAERTILFYMHFDGQPVDPSEWDQPDPFKAVLKREKGEKYEEIDRKSVV